MSGWLSVLMNDDSIDGGMYQCMMNRLTNRWLSREIDKWIGREIDASTDGWKWKCDYMNVNLNSWIWWWVNQLSVLNKLINAQRDQRKLHFMYIIWIVQRHYKILDVIALLKVYS